MNTPTLLTIRQFCEQNPAFTQGGIRFLIFNKQQNGFDKCMVRVGRKILINVSAFFLWLDEKNGGNKLSINSNDRQ